MNHIKNSFRIIGLLILTALAAPPANASLLIEPHLGYNIYGNADYDPSATTYNGAQYGARFGVQFEGIMGGFDYTHSSFAYETTVSGVTSNNDDKKRDQIGLFFGYNFPVFVRAWFGYYFLDKLTQTGTGAHATAGSWSKGTGSEFGVGFSGVPFVSFNLQYRSSSYDKDSGLALKHNASPKEIVIGISVPFTYQ